MYATCIISALIVCNTCTDARRPLYCLIRARPSRALFVNFSPRPCVQLQCLDLRAAPAAWFLAAPAAPALRLCAALAGPRGAAATAVAGVVTATSWVTTVDVSHNNLQVLSSSPGSKIPLTE